MPAATINSPPAMVTAAGSFTGRSRSGKSSGCANRHNRPTKASMQNPIASAMRSMGADSVRHAAHPCSVETLTPSCPGPDRHTRSPIFRAPPGATDCHAHIFGPVTRFPYAAKRTYTPETCSAEDYDAMQAAIGFSRAALVHAGAHGTDNSVTLDAISRRPESFRGVAIIPSGLPPAELARLDAGGMRACRLSTLDGFDFTHLSRLAAETHEFGWHVLLHFRTASELLD